jgi:hypothetical protein
MEGNVKKLYFLTELFLYRQRASRACEVRRFCSSQGDAKLLQPRHLGPSQLLVFAPTRDATPSAGCTHTHPHPPLFIDES